MPIYSYKCDQCGRAQDLFNRIDDRDANPPVCCGEKAARQLTACMIFVPGDIAYKCPVTDQIVTSERQRHNIMREHRLIDANDFPPEKVFAAAKKKRQANADLAAQLTKDIPEYVKQQAAEIMAP